MLHTRTLWLRALGAQSTQAFSGGGSRCRIVEVSLRALPLGGCRLRSTAPRCPAAQRCKFHYHHWAMLRASFEAFEECAEQTLSAEIAAGRAERNALQEALRQSKHLEATGWSRPCSESLHGAIVINIDLDESIM